MNTILLALMLTTIITFVVMFLASLLSKKTTIDREKSSPFECGFDPKAPARIPFSLQFFLIAVIFLIFDVEIALLLPITITSSSSLILPWTSISLIFLLILLLGLYHEWNQGSLNWAS
uniref:NADH-ubiquinone oxidoreductase chain 3 n=1 Tax=Ctenolepisma villosum TaxID=257043 RepID=A0A6C0UAF4_9INSE|nr:NADH dehydrogenase subunit 3 [Ctenolepisma villosum]QIB71365.1 NADH dehydrogenase subunit 3 [Ctenolepisma villosum]